MTEFKAMKQFSIKRMYLMLRGTRPKVYWRKLICNDRGCHKWKFVLWLVLKEGCR